jgi:FkbM family methyltransferase
MIYSWLRAYILVWNNSPLWFKQTARFLGLHALMVRCLTSYQRAPLHPTEEDVARELANGIQPGTVAVDVGANFGVLTEIMARAAGRQGQVIAFEAHPDNAEVLRARCRWLQQRGECAPVDVRNVAVNDGKTSEVLLHAGRRHSANEWNITGKDVTGRSTAAELRIPATSLDTALSSSSRPVKMIKIDVEGAESLVFAGMLELLRKHRPVLVVEFHSDDNWKKRSLLIDLGYRFYDLNGREVTHDSQCQSHVKAVPGAAIGP